jgi:hypothetical protein
MTDIMKVGCRYTLGRHNVQPALEMVPSFEG